MHPNGHNLFRSFVVHSRGDWIKSNKQREAMMKEKKKPNSRKKQETNYRRKWNYWRRWRRVGSIYACDERRTRTYTACPDGGAIIVGSTTYVICIYTLSESQRPCRDKGETRRCSADRRRRRSAEENTRARNAIRNHFWIIKITIITYSTVWFFSNYLIDGTEASTRVLLSSSSRARRRDTQETQIIIIDEEKISVRSQYQSQQIWEKILNHTENKKEIEKSKMAVKSECDRNVSTRFCCFPKKCCAVTNNCVLFLGFDNDLSIRKIHAPRTTIADATDSSCLGKKIWSELGYNWPRCDQLLVLRKFVAVMADPSREQWCHVSHELFNCFFFISVHFIRFRPL